MTLKTRAALLGAKGVKAALRVVGRKGTHNVGVVAQKVDRDILRSIPKPERIICVTGTNGKTTTNNLILDSLDAMGEEAMGNRLGSNIYYGIISALVSSSTLSGKQPSLGVLEVDELWSRKIFVDLVPDTLTITNILQDSFERNGNVFFVRRRIEEGIPKDTKLILNGDDAVSAHLDVPNEKVYFSIARLEGEKECYDSKVQDVIYCPSCDEEVQWSFKRYHHMGKYHCPNCDFSEPESTYVVTRMDEASGVFYVEDHGSEVKLPITQPSVESIYNQLAAYATLRENGFSAERVAAAMSSIQIIESRHRSFKLGEKDVISMASKCYNPIAQSRVYDYVGQSDRPKTVIILEDHKENPVLPMRTSGALFATNFGYLDNNLTKLMISGDSHYEIKLVCMMDGIDEDKIILIDKEEEIKEHIDPSSREELYILHDIEDANLAQAYKVEGILREHIGGAR